MQFAFRSQWSRALAEGKLPGTRVLNEALQSQDPLPRRQLGLEVQVTSSVTYTGPAQGHRPCPCGMLGARQVHVRH